MNDYPDDDSKPTMRGAASASGRRLRPGDVLLGRYTVLSELGEGGMGVVYKCLDAVGGIEVAVKCLPPEVSRATNEMEDIRDNYRLVAKLHHSAISGLRNLERDPADGDYYVIMDLAEGDDLSGLLRHRHGRPMPVAEAFEILRPLADALDYAHGEGVLHRDVKPANMKVRAVPGGPPRVQLLDFGLAAQVRTTMLRVSLRGHAGASGTPEYMAPEQWEARTPDFRTDQYALGVVAYELLAGHRPFESDDTDLLRRAVLSRAPDPVDGLSNATNAALLRALAKNPKDRFPTCAAFVAALARGVRGSHAENAESAEVGEKSHAEFAEDAESGETSSPSEPQRTDSSSIDDEAALLLRKAALKDALDAIPHADRSDKDFGSLANEAVHAFAAAEDALKFGRLAVAEKCLDHADNALVRLHEALLAREENPRRKVETRRKEEECLVSASRSKAGDRTVVQVGSVDIALRWCPPGSFMMGSPEDEEGRGDDETQHRVTLTKGFWLGETEVTQGLWTKVMGHNPSSDKSHDEYPAAVEQVSWNDCQKFLSKLNAQAPVAWFKWTLPTEAQWEYACRAGTTGRYAGTGWLDDMGWYNVSGNFYVSHTMHRVGTKKANAWGLFDMHGNMCEWCADWYGSYTGDVTDPTGPSSGSDRVFRGGSWRSGACSCRSANRSFLDPDYRISWLGVRIALIPVQ